MFGPSPSTSGKRARASEGAEAGFVMNGSSPSRLKRTKTASASTVSSPSGLPIDSNLIASEKSSGLKRSRTAGSITRSPAKMFDSPPLGKKKKLQRTYSRKPAAYTSEDGNSAERIIEQPEEELPVKDVAYKKAPATIVSDPLRQSQEVEVQQTVAPLDTLHHKPQPSPLNSSAFLSPASISDQFTQPTLNTYSELSIDQNHMAAGFESVNPNLLFPEMSSTVAASSSSIEKRLAGTPKVDVEHNLQAEHTPPHSHDRSPIQDKPNQEDNSLGTASSSGKTGDIPDQAATEKADDPLDKRQKKYKSIASSDAALPPSDDLIGLPKEMYKPRPSRSRSVRPTQAETPASSEAAAGRLKKPRRSRTADGMSANTTQKLVDMGFTASQSEAALIETDWVFDKALDVLVTRAKSKSVSPLVEKSYTAAEDIANKITQPSLVEETGELAPTNDVEVDTEITHDTPDIDETEQVNGDGDVRSKPDAGAPPVADAEKDTDVTLSQGRTQDLVEFAQRPAKTDAGDSPSSNTKLKRTKSTKSRGRPKKSDAKVVEDEQQEVDEISASAVPEARAKDASKTETPQVVVKTDSKPAKRPREDKETSQMLPPARGPAVDAEIIEIDDDSDGPPKATKLRRMMTAPASVLRKEKKKRGRPGKKTKTEETEAKVEESTETSLAKEDVAAPGASQATETEKREALQALDKNVASTDKASPQDSVEPTIEPIEATKKTKKAKANSKNIDTTRKTPSRETPQAPVNGEEDAVEKPSTPKTSDTGKSATKETANAADGGDMSKKDTTVKKKGGHSPIKNVIRTVNYRVGLSKRTKIEPLLKMKRR